jgi:hypothetical protein
LEVESGSQAVKQRGLRVIRAVVTKTSSLIGKSAAGVDFRNTFKAAIIAVQKGGRNAVLSGVVFGSGDVLVLQVSDDSPLLIPPPPDFYKRLTEANKDMGTASRSNSVASFVNRLTKTKSNVSIENLNKKTEGDDHDVEAGKSNDVDERKPDEKKPIDPDDEGFFIGSGEYAEEDLMAGDNEVMITDMVSWTVFSLRN